MNLVLKIAFLHSHQEIIKALALIFLLIKSPYYSKIIQNLLKLINADLFE